MKINIVLFSAFMALNLVACTSSVEMEAEAQAKYTAEKTETLKEYKECVKASEGDATKMTQCDALLKAVEAVEGGK